MAKILWEGGDPKGEYDFKLRIVKPDNSEDILVYERCWKQDSMGNDVWEELGAESRGDQIDEIAYWLYSNWINELTSKD